MKHVGAAVALIVAAVATPRAQSSIAGRVVADDSGESVPNARVALNVPNSHDGADRRRRQGVGEFQAERSMIQHESCGFIPMCG